MRAEKLLVVLPNVQKTLSLCQGKTLEVKDGGSVLISS